MRPWTKCTQKGNKQATLRRGKREATLRRGKQGTSTRKIERGRTHVSDNERARHESTVNSTRFLALRHNKRKQHSHGNSENGAQTINRSPAEEMADAKKIHMGLRSWNASSCSEKTASANIFYTGSEIEAFSGDRSPAQGQHGQNTFT